VILFSEDNRNIVQMMSCLLAKVEARGVSLQFSHDLYQQQQVATATGHV
jgi:hypothetical protein